MIFMKRIGLIVLVFVSLFSVAHGDFDDFGFKPLARKLRYKEDFFRLYNRWLYADEDSISRNIFFLELAFAVPFDNPIKALVPITSKKQYEKYKDLLMMQISMLLTKQYLILGNYYMKEKIYFFNREFFKDYLLGFDVAELRYKEGLDYWHYALKYAKKADAIHGVHMDLRFWGKNFDYDDLLYKIKTGEINYNKVIQQRLARVRKNRNYILSIISNKNP